MREPQPAGKPTNDAARRVAGLDTLRALAIVLVFTRHIPTTSDHPWLVELTKIALVGVDLSFMLSGYLIGSQIVAPLVRGSRLELKRFFGRRLLRTLPCYVVVLGLYYLWPAFRERPTLPPLWRLVTFTQNFGLNYDVHGAFAHAWSLCIEEQFYLVLPLLALAFWRFATPLRITLGSLAIIGSGMILRAMAWRHHLSGLAATGHYDALFAAYCERIFFPTYARLDSLTLGVLMAAIARMRPRFWERLIANGRVAAILSAVLLAGAITLLMDPTTYAATAFGFPLTSLGFASLLIAALSPKCALSRARIPGAKLLATLAYAAYLTHRQVIAAIQRHCLATGWDGSSLPVLAASIGASLVVAALLHALVGKPFLQLRERLFSGST